MYHHTTHANLTKRPRRRPIMDVSPASTSVLRRCGCSFSVTRTDVHVGVRVRYISFSPTPNLLPSIHRTVWMDGCSRLHSNSCTVFHVRTLQKYYHAVVEARECAHALRAGQHKLWRKSVTFLCGLLKMRKILNTLAIFSPVLACANLGFGISAAPPGRLGVFCAFLRMHVRLRRLQSTHSPGISLAK